MSHSSMRCGRQLSTCPDLLSAIQNATNQNYQFVVTRITHQRSKEFTPFCDLQLTSQDWSTLIVGEISTVDFDIKPNEKETDAEITYAMHLGLPALLFDMPKTEAGIARLARLINAKLAAGAGYQNSPQIWIRVPMQYEQEKANLWRNDVDDLTDKQQDTWLTWNLFRNLISPDKRLSVVLELNGDLPDDPLLQRWGGEPVKAIIIPTSSFLTNRKSFPVLSKAYQLFILFIINKTAKDIQFVIKGHSHHEYARYYSQYIEHLKVSQFPADAVSHFAKGYEDYLQIPLQPLMDNLESCTYEVFEKDPVKYAEYQHAILGALKSMPEKDEIMIMVVGAGRGPLVYASLRAADECKRKVHIYAVEKNTNAIVTLETLRRENWGGDEGIPIGKVDVISSDMRDWVAPRKADLVISELLGSFGDNELSPECLDGVYTCCDENTISIPCSYTSYLAPIQSQKLYTEASMLREKDKPAYTPFETGYVVHMKNYHPISDTKALFTFEHKNLLMKPQERDNSRFAQLKFESDVDVTCHGFAEYFETTLFGNVKLSTEPKTHTPGMFSWFPIYFPIHEPIVIKAKQEINVMFWRLLNKRQVWYEWCFTSPVTTAIHNVNGRSYSIGLQ